mmetsp:Transcript_59950/g.89018  ORF Transcript_59950/g.89018 Transcript_59950/m.89018 type:complete len:776 (+) Transcript_59950:601-2928(+)
MPFSFAVTFPETTYATTGDTVQAIGSFKSHLKIPVLIGAVNVLTNVGIVNIALQTLVPSCSKALHQVGNFESSGNASEDGFLLQPNMEVFFKARIDLPTDKSKITSLSGDQSSATKHAVKNVKPVSAGFTRAGGACYTLRPSVLLAKTKSTTAIKSDANEVSALLNGSSVACEGIVLTVRSPRCGMNGRGIIATLRSERRGLGPLLPPTKGVVAKQSHFEEDNYVSSAWARPPYHPLSLGPRCIRVLGAMPQLEIMDLTTSQTNSKLMEGTINRIVLCLRAGEHEQCRDLKISFTCTSEDGDNDKISRIPMLVVKDGDESDIFTTDEGFELPSGWKPRGNKDGTGSKEDFELVTSKLDSGSAVFVHFDLFRPLSATPMTASSSQEEIPVKTSFEVSVVYNQIRENSDSLSGHGDPVIQHFRGSVVWCAPIGATFSIVEGVQKSYPSGSCHLSNIISKGPISATSQKSLTKIDSFNEMTSEVASTDGEVIKIRCSLQADEAANSLAAEIRNVSFEAPATDTKGSDSQCDLSLVSGSGCDNGLLYSPQEGDVCHLLNSGAKIGISYAVQANLRGLASKSNNDNTRQHLSTTLGVISVEWLPIGLTIEKNVVEDILKGKSNGVDCDGQTLPSALEHGPLRLSKPSRVSFFGPICHIEDAPFNAVLTAFPPSPRVAIPFEVKYCITNKTPLHQKLSVSMSEASSRDRSSDGVSDSVLVSGMVNGEIHLGPFEAKTLSYSALAIRAGKTPMPSLTVSSFRHKSWVINDGPMNPRHFFVLP